MKSNGGGTALKPCFDAVLVAMWNSVYFDSILTFEGYVTARPIREFLSPCHEVLKVAPLRGNFGVKTLKSAGGC